MALNIKDAETDRLARDLAELTGTTITDALKTALRHELATARARTKVKSGRRELLDEIAARGRARPMISDLTEDEILGYDEYGIPS